MMPWQHLRIERHRLSTWRLGGCANLQISWMGVFHIYNVLCTQGFYLDLRKYLLSLRDFLPHQPDTPWYHSNTVESSAKPIWVMLIHLLMYYSTLLLHMDHARWSVSVCWRPSTSLPPSRIWLVRKCLSLSQRKLNRCRNKVVLRTSPSSWMSCQHYLPVIGRFLMLWVWCFVLTAWDAVRRKSYLVLKSEVVCLYFYFGTKHMGC